MTMRATNRTVVTGFTADRASGRTAQPDGLLRTEDSLFGRPQADETESTGIVRARRDAPAPRAPEPRFAGSRQVSWSPVAARGQTVAVEQYRRLAASLVHAQVEQGVTVVMITSSVAREGKSLTAANLAVTLAQSYERNTLLIDADQRDPSQHHIFHVDNARGLSDFLRAPEGGPVATLRVMPNLTLLPAGRPTSDPMRGLTSPQMGQLLADAAKSFDFVIIDTPPASLIPDANLLAPQVDAVILVIAAGSTQFDAIESAIEAVGRDRILGTVLNRADKKSFGRYGYGYGYPGN